MKVFFSFSEAEGKVRDSVVSIGMFDGVHAGHKKIINHVRRIAEEMGGQSTLVTFWPHPRQVLSNDLNSLKLISTLDEKIDLLSRTGLQNLVVQTFTVEFSETSSNQFLQDYLSKFLDAKAIVVGKNHFFGHNREGNFEVIREFASEFGVLARQIPLELIDNETISSAKIREALSNGDISKANQLLEYQYFVSGTLTSNDMNTERLCFVKEHPIKLLPSGGQYNCLLTIGKTDYHCSAHVYQTKGKDNVSLQFSKSIEFLENSPTILTFIG